MIRFRFVLLGFTLGLAGCGSSEFGPGSVKGLLEGAPLALSGEQVTLKQTQVDCGVQNELWDAPVDNVAKLTQKGRDLQFSDDVRLNDPDIRVPFTQVNGSFPVQVAQVLKLRSGDAGTKLADVKLSVVINHECFNTPLPMMGVRKGKFAPDAPVVFQLKGAGNEWSLDKLVH